MKIQPLIQCVTVSKQEAVTSSLSALQKPPWVFKLRKPSRLETSFLSTCYQAGQGREAGLPVPSGLTQRKTEKAGRGSNGLSCSFVMATTSPEAEEKPGFSSLINKEEMYARLQTNHHKHQGSLQQGAVGFTPDQYSIPGL